MKKWIIASACILTFSGYAAAQQTPAKATETTTAKTQKKGAEATTPNKKGAKKATVEPIKLTIPRINDSDTLTSIPKSGRK
jgi:acyl-CoA synthetase (AMP-forming)/AMP-acid ligase II